MGSVAHARALHASGARVRAMISLESVGYFSDAPGSQHYPAPEMALLYPTRGDFIGVVGTFADAPLVRRVREAMRAASPLPVRSIDAPRLIPGIDFSDHASYWDQDYPAVMITDSAFYRNARYHHSDDTADTLDYHRLAEVVRGAACAVEELAR
jgi:hypothetical protein